MEEKENGEVSFCFLEKESRYEVDMIFYSSHRDIHFLFLIFLSNSPLRCVMWHSRHTQYDVNLRQKEL